MAGRGRPCRCESGKKAKYCCLKPESSLFNKPTVIKRRNQTYSHPKCYLRGLGDCSEKISGEHHMSESILNLMNNGRPTRVRGYPFASGPIYLSPAAQVSKVLCTFHNSDLSPLDEVGRAVYQAINDAWHRQGPQKIRVSGHDLERFFLQRLCAQHFGGVTALNGEHPHHTLDTGMVENMLIHNRWPAKAGPYIARPHVIPDFEAQYPGYEFAPIFGQSATGEDIVVGCRYVFNGLFFFLLLDPHYAPPHPLLADKLLCFRPSLIAAVEGYVGSRVEIQLDWMPGSKHGGDIVFPSVFLEELVSRPGAPV